MEIKDYDQAKEVTKLIDWMMKVDGNDPLFALVLYAKIYALSENAKAVGFELGKKAGLAQRN